MLLHIETDSDAAILEMQLTTNKMANKAMNQRAHCAPLKRKYPATDPAKYNTQVKENRMNTGEGNGITGCKTGHSSTRPVKPQNIIQSMPRTRYVFINVKWPNEKS